LSITQTVAHAARLVLDANNTQHFSFTRIAPSTYQFDDAGLLINVTRSASFLQHAFRDKRLVSQVSFDWKLLSGELLLRDSAHESRRDGDDAVFKFGLLIEGSPEIPNPLTPAWLQQANAALSFPSGRLIYIAAAARHGAGEHWQGPYNKRIEMIAAASTPGDDGWSHASLRLESPQSVVGVWLMADGDNTGSTFAVRVKNIGLE
jgi:hypothetical protein